MSVQEVVFGFGAHSGVDEVPELLSMVQQADREGLDIFSLSDHPYLGGRLDAYASLGFILGRTRHISGFANVTNLPTRPAPMLARTVTSLSALSGGRIVLGMGAGRRITDRPLTATRDRDGRWIGGSVDQWAEELTGAVLEHGASGFMLFSPKAARRTSSPSAAGPKRSPRPYAKRSRRKTIGGGFDPQVVGEVDAEPVDVLRPNLGGVPEKIGSVRIPGAPDPEQAREREDRKAPALVGRRR
jgi:alkanesulfonate monooxygenase SsuD/methylene tetrahydromethanopterin reductase-like flavin-dependent oxidoreductase (luciferase family)